MKQKAKRRKRKHTTATKVKSVKGVNLNTNGRKLKREPWRVQGESLSIRARSKRNNI